MEPPPILQALDLPTVAPCVTNVPAVPVVQAPCAPSPEDTNHEQRRTSS